MTPFLDTKENLIDMKKRGPIKQIKSRAPEAAAQSPKFSTDCIKHSLLAAQSPNSKTNNTWKAGCIRRLKIFKRASDIDWYRWYESNTRHHLSVFEQYDLPRDVKYVWSFFSGPCPEFLALEQYINPGFHYTAIDSNLNTIFEYPKRLAWHQ
jgi:hypothetical protein